MSCEYFEAWQQQHASSSEECRHEPCKRTVPVAVPPSAMHIPTRRKRYDVVSAVHAAVYMLAWTAIALLVPRRSSASAIPGDTVIQARLPPPARGSWASDYLCTAVALPSDPLKLVQVVPAVAGSAADMLLYGAPLDATGPGCAYRGGENARVVCVSFLPPCCPIQSARDSCR